MSRLQTHWLNKHKRYPRRAEYRGYEGTVLVTFVVSRHGEILDYKIKHSSGNILLDKEALATIRRTRSLPVFPDELVEAWDTITRRLRAHLHCCPNKIPTTTKIPLKTQLIFPSGHHEKLGSLPLRDVASP